MTLRAASAANDPTFPGRDSAQQARKNNTARTRHKHNQGEPVNGMIARPPKGSEVRVMRGLPSCIGVSRRFCCSGPCHAYAPSAVPLLRDRPSVPSTYLGTKSPTRRGTSQHSHSICAQFYPYHCWTLRLLLGFIRGTGCSRRRARHHQQRPTSASVQAWGLGDCTRFSRIRLGDVADLSFWDFG